MRDGRAGTPGRVRPRSRSSSGGRGSASSSARRPPSWTESSTSARSHRALEPGAPCTLSTGAPARSSGASMADRATASSRRRPFREGASTSGATTARSSRWHSTARSDGGTARTARSSPRRPSSTGSSTWGTTQASSMRSTRRPGAAVGNSRTTHRMSASSPRLRSRGTRSTSLARLDGQAKRPSSTPFRRRPVRSDGASRPVTRATSTASRSSRASASTSPR